MLRGFGAPGCHPSSLIDLVNTALASEGSEKPTRMISEGYRSHRVVTGSMTFKEIGRFFGKSCSRGFGVPGCHPSTLFNLANTALASRVSVETKCTVWEDCRTHRVVTGPMNFKKSGLYSEDRAPGVLGPWLPARHFI